MADDFGLKIGVEGEREFRAALKNINQQFKVLGSEMKLVESRFDKQDRSVSALTSRNEVLNRQIAEQKEKIELLRRALENAAESFGENDRRTQQWAVQLNNAEAELNNMERELKNNEKAIDGVGDEFQDAEKQADGFGDEVEDAADRSDRAKDRFEKLGSVLKGVGAAMGSVLVAAGTVAYKIGKAVVEQFGEKKQLLVLIALLVLTLPVYALADTGGTSAATDVLIENAVNIAAAFFIALIGVFGAWLTAKLGKITQLDTVNKAQQELIKLAQITVGELKQTVVDGMKAASKDGKLTKEEIAQLGQLLYEKTTAKLSASAMDVLTAAQVDISALITGTAEHLIGQMKAN